jgi:hypothetical protein
MICSPAIEGEMGRDLMQKNSGFFGEDHEFCGSSFEAIEIPSQRAEWITNKIV